MPLPRLTCPTNSPMSSGLPRFPVGPARPSAQPRAWPARPASLPPRCAREGDHEPGGSRSVHLAVPAHRPERRPLASPRLNSRSRSAPRSTQTKPRLQGPSLSDRSASAEKSPTSWRTTRTSPTRVALVRALQHPRCVNSRFSRSNHCRPNRLDREQEMRPLRLQYDGTSAFLSQCNTAKHWILTDYRCRTAR
jgi:hypothetical protein